jgi:hypothetical protein
MSENLDNEFVILPRLDDLMTSPPLLEENVVVDEGFIILPLDADNELRESEPSGSEVMEEDVTADAVVITRDDSDVSSTMSEDFEETRTNSDNTIPRHRLSDLIDRRARIALGGGDFSVVVGVDGKTVYEMDPIAMRRQTDELLMYCAGTRLVEKLIETMLLACDCGGCEDCTRLSDWRSGRKAIEWRDVADYSVMNWVFYAIELTSSTPRYDEDRLFWLANQRWDADTGEIISPRLVEYLKPLSLIDEAARTLVVRIAAASDECARRRTNHVSRLGR